YYVSCHLCIPTCIYALRFDCLNPFLGLKFVKILQKVIIPPPPGSVPSPPAVTAATKRQELTALTDIEHGRIRSLIGLNPETEKVLIKLTGPRRVGHKVSGVTPVAESHQSFLWRWFGLRTRVAERSDPAGIVRILQLNEDAVGIAKE